MAHEKESSIDKPEADLVEPEKTEQQDQIRIAQIWQYATRMDIVYLVVGVIGSLVAGVGWPLLSVVFGDVVDVFVDFESQRDKAESPDRLEQDFMNDVYKYSAIMFGVGVVYTVGNYLTIYCFQSFSLRQMRIIKKRYFHALLRQEIAWHDNQNSGEFASRLSSDFKKFESGINENLGLLIYNFSAGSINLIVGIVYGWKLGLVILSLTPVMGLTAYIITKMQARFLQKEIASHSLASSAAEEVVSAIRTVFAFNGQDKEKARYEKLLIPAMKNGCKRSFVTSIASAANWCVIYASLALGIWYGVKLIHDPQEDYSIGTVVIVFWGIVGCGFNIGYAAPYIESFQIGRTAAAGIFKLIERTSAIDSLNENGLKLQQFKTNIEFRDVHFSYPTRPKVKILEGLNLSIRQGETVAIVGASGSGKSTVVQLIQRFYDANQGQVLFSDVDIKKLDVGWLRQQLGVVGQEPILFDATIEQNIRLGLSCEQMQTVDHEQIVKAAEQANAHEFIKRLPNGYNTYVGDRGAQLSGGQKQRIAIARALVSNPGTLLLDESTSALDMKSEHIVQTALDRASKGRTTIIVAHRLSTIMNADRIIYLENGQVLEMGTHEQLMEKQSAYYKLVRAQQVRGEKKKKPSFTIDSHPRPLMVAMTNSFLRTSSRASSVTSIASSVLQLNAQLSIERTQEELQIAREAKFPYGRITKLILKDKIYFTIALVAALLYGTVTPIYALIFGGFVNTFALQNDVSKQEEETLIYAIEFVILAVAVFIVAVLQVSLFGIVSEKLTLRLRLMAYSAILTQEIAFFDQKENSAGALCARLANDVANIQGATGMRIAMMCQAVSTLVFSIAMGFAFNWRMAAVSLGLMPVLIYATKLSGELYTQQANEDSRSAQLSSKLAIEVMNAMRTVVSLHKQNFFYAKFNDNLNEHFKAICKKINYKSLVISLSLGAPFASYALMFLWGGFLLKNKLLGSGDFFRIIESMLFGAIVVGQTAILSADFTKAKIAAVNIFKLIDRTPQTPSDALITSVSGKPNKLEGNISFRGVYFHYPNRHELSILNGLSFSASKGETIGLVGESGCGKSTCIQLLEQFYNPAKGAIYLDGQPIANSNVDWIRSQMALVQQEPILFSYSIRDNIAYGDNSRTDIAFDEIVRAAQMANIHEFIQQLPQGYDTPVGGKGSQLSGGQKQRIAIARSLVRNPCILLLDEATSALDTESEKIVQEALDKASQGRTCIVIAHRLKTIVNADKIVVINKGVNVEEGTHDELVQLGGHYCKLYNSALQTTNSSQEPK